MIPTRQLAAARRPRRSGAGEAGPGRRSPPAARDRGRRRVPRAHHAAAGHRAARQPPPDRALGARRARAAARRPRRRGAASSTRTTAASSRASDADEVRRRLVADWWAARDPDGSVMIAHRRADVADLNGRARALMRASGALGDVELRLAAGALRRRRPCRAAPQRPAARRRQRRPRHRDRGRPGGPDARHRARRAGRFGSTPATSTRRRGTAPALQHALRDHRPRGAGADVPADVRARHRSDLARVGLQRAQPWPGEQPALRRHRRTGRASRVRARRRSLASVARTARGVAGTLRGADASPPMPAASSAWPPSSGA